MSDKDVLIISGDRDAKGLASSWHRNGWSVTAMTEERFEALRQFGSLFVEHVRREGLLVRDDSAFLKRALSRPSNNFIDSASFTADIEFLFQLNSPMSDWAALCYADMSYVLIRNAGVNICASRGACKFAFDEIIAGLSKDISIYSEEIQALHQLRRLKSSYRRRHPVADCRKLVLVALSGARKLLGAFASENNVICVRNGYQRLRMFEISLVNALDPRLLDSMTYENPLYDIWQLVRSPTDYPIIKQIDQAWIDRAFTMAQVAPLYAIDV